jgi:hypothetical protein
MIIPEVSVITPPNSSNVKATVINSVCYSMKSGLQPYCDKVDPIDGFV